MPEQSAVQRVLVVDDNRDVADLTVELLAMHGYDAVAAYGGAEGVTLAQNFSPNVVLLDLGMPQLDGFEVAVAIRQCPSLEGVKLIAYSAWGDAATVQRARAWGFNAHIVKPAQVDEILKVVSVC